MNGPKDQDRGSFDPNECDQKRSFRFATGLGPGAHGPQVVASVGIAAVSIFTIQALAATVVNMPPINTAIGTTSVVSIPLPAIYDEEHVRTLRKMLIPDSLAILSEDHLLRGFIDFYFWVPALRHLWEAVIHPQTRLLIMKDGQLLRTLHPEGKREIVLNFLTNGRKMQASLGMSPSLRAA